MAPPIHLGAWSMAMAVIISYDTNIRTSYIVHSEKYCMPVVQNILARELCNAYTLKLYHTKNSVLNYY